MTSVVSFDSEDLLSLPLSSEVVRIPPTPLLQTKTLGTRTTSKKSIGVSTLVLFYHSSQSCPLSPTKSHLLPSKGLLRMCKKLSDYFRKRKFKSVW